APRRDAGPCEIGVQPHGCAEIVAIWSPTCARFLVRIAVGRRSGVPGPAEEDTFGLAVSWAVSREQMRAGGDRPLRAGAPGPAPRRSRPSARGGGYGARRRPSPPRRGAAGAHARGRRPREPRPARARPRPRAAPRAAAR